jgi:hypothetical protein
MVTGADLSIDGDKVTIANLTVSNQELASYLADKEPGEQLVAIVDLINLAVSIKNMAGGQIGTESMKQSAELVVQGLNGTVAALNESITSKVAQILDPETGVIAQKIRETASAIGDTHDSKLRELLSPKKEGTPIATLQNAITDSLNAHVTGIKTDIAAVTELVNQFIGSQQKGKELYAKSREKGGDLEWLLDSMIQSEAAVHGDTAMYTGDTQSPSGRNTGDEVVIMNPSVTKGEEVKIVWEAKTEAKFKNVKGRLKQDKVAEELMAAIENRGAVCGIFVSDARDLDLSVQPIWQEFEGNKLIIVLDDEDPDQRLVRMAYLWARSYALRALSPEENELDVEAIDRVLKALQREFNTLSTLKGMHTPIKENVLKAITFVEEFEGSIDKQMAELVKLMSVAEAN